MKLIKIIIAVSMLLTIQSANLFAQQPPTTSNGCVSGNCVNGKGKMVYANGNTYEGDWVDGKQNGYGKEFIKATNTTQEGTWKDGVFVNATKDESIIDLLKEELKIACVSGNCVNGKGKMVDPFVIYEGDFVNGKREGQGTLTPKNGKFVFVGQFANNEINGKGKITFTSGDIYEGDFVNGKREGQGTFTFKNGDYHTGEWKNEMPNGHGKEYKKANNAMREGTWKDGDFVDTKAATSTPKNSNQCVSGNCVNGKGKMVYGFITLTEGAGDIYEGDFVDGKRQGKGIFTDKLFGRVYEGDFVNGNRQGQGTLTSKNGDVYSGEFDRDPNGKGKMKYANGDTYEGGFQLGVRHREGTLTLKNGDIISSWFFLGEIGNKVKIKYVSGDIYEGDFKSGKFDGQGTFTYKNGNYYAGEWKGNVPHGSGKQYIKANNATREGVWKDGVYVGATKPN